MSARKRVLLVALLTTLGSSLAVPKPAFADEYSRQRTGVSRWSPQQGTVRIAYVNSAYSRIEWHFVWGDILHRNEADGRHRALELKTITPSGYAAGYGGYVYDNFPSGARPYRDTLASDTTCCNFGYGAADANFFALGKYYTAHVDVWKQQASSSYFQIRSEVRAASRLDHNVSCAQGDTWCVFPDYVHYLIRGRDMNVRQADSPVVNWYHNRLANQSFESGLAPYNVPGGANRVVYCNGTGFGSSCFLEFNRGSAPSVSVWQDVAITSQPGDHYTVEAMLRCPINQGSCPVTLAYWGLGVSANESRSAYHNLNSDGRWYHCRLDFEHGAGNGLAGSHNVVRWEIYNHGQSQNVDVDFTTLALYTNRTPYTVGDPVAPPDWLAPVCVLASQFNA